MMYVHMVIRDMRYIWAVDCSHACVHGRPIVARSDGIHASGMNGSEMMYEITSTLIITWNFSHFL